MNEVLIFLLGLFIAGFFTGGIGFVLWHMENSRAAHIKTEYDLLAAKLDGLEEMQLKLEVDLNEKEEAHQRTCMHLQHAGEKISQLSQVINMLNAKQQQHQDSCNGISGLN